MRILLIEGDALTIELCTLAFGVEGHDVATSAPDRDAVRAAIARHTDVILLDIVPAGLLEMLRGLEEARATPLVVLTSFARLEDEIGAWERGADAFVRKPFSPVGLVDVVAALAGLTAEERRSRRSATLGRIRVVQRRLDRAREDRRMRTGLASLTPVERRVATLVGEGVRLKPACARLGIAEGTFWAHKGAIRRKLAVPRNEPLEAFLHRLELSSRPQCTG